MKRFAFSLEKVLRYKKLLKEQKQARLLKANQIYFACRQELEHLKNQLLERKNSLFTGRLSPAILVHRASYIEFLASLVAAQEKKTEDALAHVRKCRQDLIEADQEQQVLEKLKGRKHQEYLYHIERELQKELDEVAASVYSRRS